MQIDRNTSGYIAISMKLYRLHRGTLRRKSSFLDADKVSVFDIDGTLIDDSERYREAILYASGNINTRFSDLNERGRKLFREMYNSIENYGLDKPIERGLKELDKAVRNGDIVVILTGRPESQYVPTFNQLKKFDIRYDMLFMRRDLSIPVDIYKYNVMRLITELFNKPVVWHDDDIYTVNYVVDRLHSIYGDTLNMTVCSHWKKKRLGLMERKRVKHI